MAQRQRRHSCFCLNALIVVEVNVFVDQIICFSARMHRAAAHAPARPAARRDGIYARFYRLCSAPDAHRPSAEHRGGKAQPHVAVFLPVPQSGAACCTSSPDAPRPRASVSSWSGCSKSWTRDSKSSYTFIPPSLSSPPFHAQTTGALVPVVCACQTRPTALGSRLKRQTRTKTPECPAGA